MRSGRAPSHLDGVPWPLVSWLFEATNEVRMSGGEFERGRKRLREMFYTRLEWPEPGGLGMQLVFVVEVLTLMRAEMTRKLIGGR